MSFLPSSLKAFVDAADRLLTRFQLSIGFDQPSLISLLFHHVFRDEEEIALEQVQPQERVTQAQYREIFGYFRKAGYEFVAPSHIEGGLHPDGKYVLVTFDDGYANNLRLLPLMEEYDVPITIFLATRYLREQMAFWWDVQYRHRLAEGWDKNRVYVEQDYLMRLQPDVRDAQITEWFGEQAWQSIDELDRPMTELEIRQAIQHPLIHVGNHTLDHSFLAALSQDWVQAQFVQSQAMIRELTGRTSSTVSYPYGSYSKHVVEHARLSGFRVGITCIPVKNYFRNGQLACDMLGLGRDTIRGDRNILAQCELARSDFSLFKRYMATKKKRSLAS